MHPSNIFKFSFCVKIIIIIIIIPGILALALATKKPLIDCLCLYFKLKDNTFYGKRPYDTEKFENLLKETFGKYTTMANIKNPKYDFILFFI